jgi:adenosine 3'-phospho 5'-phosphosulfate transporter B3
MSTGLVFFTLADSKVQPNFNLYGVIIICSALIADAAIGNYQEKIMKEHHVPNVEIVFYSFIFGFVFVLIGLIVTNNFFSSLEFWNKVCQSIKNQINSIIFFFFSASFSYLWLWFNVFNIRLLRH